MNGIILTIKGTQVQGGHKENTELTTEGSLSLKDGSGVISYGAVGELNLAEFTEIIVEGDAVIMKKSGSDETELVFQKDKVYTANFDMPFGTMDFILIPTFVDVNMKDTSGKIELEYILDISGTQLFNKLQLSYISDDR